MFFSRHLKYKNIAYCTISFEIVWCRLSFFTEHWISTFLKNVFFVFLLDKIGVRYWKFQRGGHARPILWHSYSNVMHASIVFRGFTAIAKSSRKKYRGTISFMFAAEMLRYRVLTKHDNIDKTIVCKLNL